MSRLDEFVTEVRDVVSMKNIPPEIAKPVNDWLDNNIYGIIEKTKKNLQEQPLEEIYKAVSPQVEMMGQGLEIIEKLQDDDSRLDLRDIVPESQKNNTYNVSGGIIDDEGNVPSFLFCIEKHSKTPNGRDSVSILSVTQKSIDGGANANIRQEF